MNPPDEDFELDFEDSKLPDLNPLDEDLGVLLGDDLESLVDPEEDFELEVDPEDELPEDFDPLLKLPDLKPLDELLELDELLGFELLDFELLKDPLDGFELAVVEYFVESDDEDLLILLLELDGEDFDLLLKLPDLKPLDELLLMDLELLDELLLLDLELLKDPLFGLAKTTWLSTTIAVSVNIKVNSIENKNRFLFNLMIFTPRETWLVNDLIIEY